MSEIRKTEPGNIYFVTLTTVGWIDIFTRKDYAEELIENLKYCQNNKGLEIYAWVLMPSHLHLIASAEQGKLSDILRDFKSYTAKKIIEMIKANPTESRREWLVEMFERFGSSNKQNKKYQFWQQDNNPIELYSNAVIDQKVDYIHNNPVSDGLVTLPEAYNYSSANEESEIKLEPL